MVLIIGLLTNYLVLDYREARASSLEFRVVYERDIMYTWLFIMYMDDVIGENGD